jgi:tripeptidyl-peptidase-1
MKLGVRGMSILFASGDQGACGRSGCGRNGFNPDFPGASPYITTVGGTDFAQRSVLGDEKAWTTGGGGFSNTFPVPAYQATAVASYKTTAGASLPPASQWNHTGRGYPDIAALAGQQNPYCIAAGSQMIGIAGTSAACPVVAAIFARLNAERLATGGKQMGFLNPWIYQNGATAFNDVSLGANDGGRKGQGFPATKGWDAATGWGTPNYAEMVKAL